MIRRTSFLIAALLAAGGVQAQSKLKVGLMLPATGTYAQLGTAIENGFRLYVTEQGGKLGGREIEYVKVDDESDPSKATDNVNKLIKRDNVDVLIGTVHSGVAMAMAKAAKDSGTLLIVPNAGADAVTGPMCAPNIFRSSFSNWQPGYAMGDVVAKKGHKKVVTITWKYAAGDESVRGFKEAFEKAGGQVVKDLNLPFPNVEFQALLTEIAAMKPDLATGRRAKIVIISGISSVQVLGHYASSNVIRCAWLAEAKTLAFALGDQGLHVNTLSLGGTLTPGYRASLEKRAATAGMTFEQRLAEETSNVPLHKYGTPEEVAVAVEGLLSPFSDHMTGLNILHDGGFTKAY